MPENSAIEVIDDGSFNVVQTLPIRTFKSNYGVEEYKTMIAEHQAAITPEALDALVQQTVDMHQTAIASMSIIIKAAADAGVKNAVQAVADLGV